MPVDKENEKLVMDRLTLMDDSIDSMDDVEDIQKKVFKELSLMILKELDLDINGNIKRSRKNQRAVQKMGKIRDLILTPEYKAMVGKFVGSFNQVRSMSNEQITAV